MFVGHYGPALIGKAAAKQVKLWHLFLAVQLVDIAWAILIILGIEQARIVPGFLEASDLDLYHMPYTHSLVATAGWMLFAMVAYRLRRPTAGLGGAFIIALAVGSHWFTDLIVHTQDLPLMLDGPRVGYGLWDNLLLSQIVEIGIVLLGLMFFLRSTYATSNFGKISPWLLSAVLLALQAYNHFAPPPGEIKIMAAMALVSYVLLAYVASLTDNSRAAR